MSTNKEFRVHKLDEFGLSKMQEIADIFDNALTSIINICPEGRELSIVRTKMEEACFFAKKSMAEYFSTQEIGE